MNRNLDRTSQTWIFLENAYYTNAVSALFSKEPENNQLVDGACLTITSAKAWPPFVNLHTFVQELLCNSRQSSASSHIGNNALEIVIHVETSLSQTTDSVNKGQPLAQIHSLPRLAVGSCPEVNPGEGLNTWECCLEIISLDFQH